MSQSCGPGAYSQQGLRKLSESLGMLIRTVSVGGTSDVHSHPSNCTSLSSLLVYGSWNSVLCWDELVRPRRLFQKSQFSLP